MATLSKSDRCDAAGCQAQAWVLAAFSSGDLFFCRHHYQQYRVKVDRAAVAVIDESHLINSRSESSA